VLSQSTDLDRAYQRAQFNRQVHNVLVYFRRRLGPDRWPALVAEAPNLAGTLAYALQASGTFREAFELLDDAQEFVLRHAGTAFSNDLLARLARGARQAPAAPAIATLRLTGRLYQRRGLRGPAERCYRDALARADASGLDGARALARADLGRFLVEWDAAPEGLDLLHMAVALAEACGERAALARALLTLGWYAHIVWDGASALAYIERALPILEELGDAAALGRAWLDASAAHWRLGRYDEAQASCARAQACFAGVDDARLQALAWVRTGVLHFEQGAFAEAIEWFRRAERTDRQLGDDYELAAVYQDLSVSFWGLRQGDLAEDYALRALTLGRALGRELLTVEVLINLGEVYAAQGRLVELAALLDEARALLARQDGRPALARWVAAMRGFLEDLQACVPPV
jgi:tetratricopeptide (TPR) repeat protein